MGRPGKASETRSKAAGGRGQARAVAPTQSLAPEVAFSHLGHIARGVGVVVEGACLLVVLIGRLGRHGAGLVGVLPALELDDSLSPAQLQMPSGLQRQGFYWTYSRTTKINLTRSCPLSKGEGNGGLVRLFFSSSAPEASR